MPPAYSTPLRLPLVTLPILAILLLMPSAGGGQMRPEQEEEASRTSADARRRGDPATAIRDVLQRDFRALPVDVVRIISAAGYRDAEVTQALSSLYRGDATRTAATLREARWPVSRAAGALREVLVREQGSVLADALLQAGFPPADLGEVISSVFLADAPGAAAWMLEQGWSPEAAARQLRLQYRMDAVTAAATLLGAGWSMSDVATGVDDQWAMHRDDLVVVLGTASPSSSTGSVLSAMSLAGLPVPTPVRIRYESLDTRWNHSGMRVDDGIVRREWILDPDPTDGVMWLVGRHLDRPGVKFLLGGVEGEIRSRGQEGSLDRMEVFFSGMPGALSSLSVETIWGGNYLAWGPPIPARGYDSFQGDDLLSGTGNLWIVMGDPPGEGRMESDAGAPVTFTMEPFDVAGTHIEVTGIRSTPLEPSFVPSPTPAWAAAVAFEGDLETLGPRAFEGSFFEKIPCWVCEGYQVPQTECGPLDLPCFLGELGLTLSGISAWCTNPANWRRQDLAQGPAIPFGGQIQNGRIRLVLGLNPANGGFVVPGALAEFDGSVLLDGAPSGLTAGMVEDWLEGQISSGVGGSLMGSGLPAGLEAGLAQLAAIRGWAGHLDRMFVLGNGTLRLDLGR
jgi:hypothetical protein